MRDNNIFCHFLKNCGNSNYVNYLENMLNESLKAAVYIKINVYIHEKKGHFVGISLRVTSLKRNEKKI